MQLNNEIINNFQDQIWHFYKNNGRQFAWRNIDNPYAIFISEVMLQQTQTQRVETKFEQFMAELPTFAALATVSTRDLLTVWQGLGYNRRALYLQRSAQIIAQQYAGILPNDPEILVTLPGIGKATAASICAFAFNTPTIFIETNIRTVFIHSFYKNEIDISDAQLMPLIAATVDWDNPREWYYALMDFGVYLKKQYPNPNRKSAHYAIQSRFNDSDRQIRGMIIKLLTMQKSATLQEIIMHTQKDPERVEKIITGLCKEGFIACNKMIYHIV
ncbi:MAG TPA: hypothetical protein VGT41_01210 [Candidatus Babeliales bacterium]|nr:hypothetical protein [Candidatus Babeliales bacterium]